MPPLSSPLASALCQADPDCGVRPLWNFKAGSPFYIRYRMRMKNHQASRKNHLYLYTCS